MPEIPVDVPRHYGYGLLHQALPRHAQWLVVTMPEPWQLASRQFAAPPTHLHHVTSMDEELVERTTQSFPPIEGVLGIGGGSCMDFAKYVAWKRRIPCILAPSIVSVDACLTDAIAVRRQGRVHYLGQVYPEAVLIDFELICQAPPELNRAGAGDILSIHTALFDWQLAHQQNNEPYFPEIAEQSRALLHTLFAHADAIREATPEGIQILVELFRAEVHLCYRAGSSRPEEGSEHFWAYNLEYRTRRPFVHGDLIALGVLLMSALQENDLPGIKARIQDLGLRHTPEALQIPEEVLRDSLITARDYAIDDQLNFSTLNVRPVDERLAAHLIASVH